MPVSMMPGHMALTRIPDPVSWYDIVWTSEMTAAFDAEYGVAPALERRPATEAVAIMLPPGFGFSGDVRFIAGAACLAARKTLRLSISQLLLRHRDTPLTKTTDSLQNIDFEYFHEFLVAYVREKKLSASDAGVGEEDVQSSVLFQCVIDDLLHCSFVGCVELSDVRLYVRK
jgi:hypothetical protein